MSVATITTTCTFRDEDATLTAVSPNRLRYRRNNEGDWNVWAGTISNPSTGLYSAVVTVNEPGDWTFEWYGQAGSGLERTQTAQITVA